jgi:hypothetical protein
MDISALKKSSILMGMTIFNVKHLTLVSVSKKGHNTVWNKAYPHKAELTFFVS